MSMNNNLPKFKANHGPDSNHSIIRSTSIISLGTLTSRIFGFLRDVVLAGLLGTGIRAEAFFLAFKIPNLFRDLVAEGAVNAAVVPVLSEFKQKNSQQQLWDFISIILVLGLITLSLITILGIIFAPQIVRIIAPGMMDNPAKLLLAVKLTKIMFPYLIFIGIASYCVGVLYTFRSFVAPAFSPVMLNISIIGTAFIILGRIEEPVFGLAIGVIVGGFLQLIVLIKPLLNTGFRFRFPKTLSHPGALRIGQLMIPRMFGSGVYQLTVLVDTFCASFASIVGAGGISTIYFANRIIHFPMGIFSIALASAILPTLSGFAANKDTESLKNTLIFSLESIFFIMCPTTIILMILANPIIHTIFERGEFTSYSTQVTSSALMFYSIGLFSYGGIKILVTAFHSLQDTKTPVWVAAVCLCLNAILNFILMYPLKIGGIALASSISATVDFLILYYIIEKRLGGFGGNMIGFFGKVVAAAVLTGVIEIWAWNHFTLVSGFIKLGVTGFVGIVFYLGICLVFKVEQASKIVNWIRQRK